MSFKLVELLYTGLRLSARFASKVPRFCRLLIMTYLLLIALTQIAIAGSKTCNELDTINVGRYPSNYELNMIKPGVGDTNIVCRTFEWEKFKHLQLKPTERVYESLTYTCPDSKEGRGGTFTTEPHAIEIKRVGEKDVHHCVNGFCYDHQKTCWTWSKFKRKDDGFKHLDERDCLKNFKRPELTAALKNIERATPKFLKDGTIEVTFSHEGYLEPTLILKLGDKTGELSVFIPQQNGSGRPDTMTYHWVGESKHTGNYSGTLFLKMLGEGLVLGEYWSTVDSGFKKDEQRGGGCDLVNLKGQQINARNCESCVIRPLVSPSLRGPASVND
jgi:hypothetical protein